ncbi:MAG: PDZ domain-containing protein, partial [Candidatus Geothermincolia bacterium]
MKRKNCGPAPIAAVEPGSPAAEAGVLQGDRVMRIDGAPLRDVIDLYVPLASGGTVTLEIERDGELSEVTIDLGSRSAGIEIAEPVFGEVITCDNNCMFCFVDQLPEGLRRSVYIKDDDYRLSFLSGNFITLTNLTRADVKRITGERLSPLYVSLHSTETVVRKKMFGNPEAARSLKILKELMRAGIEVHVQIVLVKGVNDRDHLDITLQNLHDRYAAFGSIGVV